MDRICYMDGWHWTVTQDENGYDVPDERLFSNGDGTYRLATDDDVSHHERFHQRFADVVMEDGGPGVRVTEEELAMINELLAKSRGGS